MNLTSRISLYDILAMILPGGLLIWCLAQMGFGGRVIAAYIRSLDTFPCKDVWIATSLLLFAYIIGLVNHILSDKLVRFCNLRNNPNHILEACNKVKSDGEWKELEKLDIVKNNGLIDVDKYYEAYSYSAKQTGNTQISIVESQIAMLESFTIPLLFAIWILKFCCMPCQCVLFCQIGVCLAIDTVIFVILRWLIKERINKVYLMILENYEYYKRLEEKPKEKASKNKPSKTKKTKQ